MDDEKRTDVRQGLEAFEGALSSRERFRRYMHYQHVDWVPHMEFGYWDSLKEGWVAEGKLPASFANDQGAVSDVDVETFFGCEQTAGFEPRLGAGPGRPNEVVEETEDKIIFRDGLGVLSEQSKGSGRSIPHFLEFPVRDRESWIRFRDEFLNVDDEWRIFSEEEWQKGMAASRTSDRTFVAGFGSFIGWIRNWVGFEGLALMAYDDPDLIEEMVAHVADMAMQLLPPVLGRMEFDVAGGWEDIAFNSGPLLSPDIFRRIILPHMKPVIRLLRQHGVDVIWTDCDGNVNDLVPIWMEAGINCLFPAEVHAGTDVFRLRKEYGRDLLVRGGFDKLVLFDSREAVLNELKRIESFVAEGGYIPHVDHRCPGGVAFEMYRYYIWEKCHLLGMPPECIRAIPGLRDYRP